jgi:hypothetical protein
MEWKVLEDDIQQEDQSFQASELTELKEIDKLAWERGERVLFVPTFYAWGRVPAEGS